MADPTATMVMARRISVIERDVFINAVPFEMLTIAGLQGRPFLLVEIYFATSLFGVGSEDEPGAASNLLTGIICSIC
jgi:hypothetical protein